MTPSVSRCGEPGWADGDDRVCDLESDHTGAHVDLYDGWEWSQGY